MSKTNLRKVPYTPVMDTLIDEFGLVTAAVFGRVWRYCQMERGYCHAEQARIADELRLSRATVNRALDVLVKAEYLQDRTNAKGRTRIYVDTGKAGLQEFPELVTQPVTQPVTGVVTEVVTEPVAQSYTNTDKTDKTGNKDNTTPGGVVSRFLDSAGEEQKAAYQLVSQCASQEKAAAVASRENPLNSAYDFIEWSARHGGQVAITLLGELENAGKLAKVKDRITLDFDAILGVDRPGHTDADLELAAEIEAERTQQAFDDAAGVQGTPTETEEPVIEPVKEPVIEPVERPGFISLREYNEKVRLRELEAAHKDGG